MIAFIWCVIFKRPFATVFQKVLLLLFDFLNSWFSVYRTYTLRDENISIFFYSWGVIEKLFENSWTIKALGLRPRASNSFLVFGTLMKPDARVFEKVRHHTRSSWTHPKGGPPVYLKPYLQPWCNAAVCFLFWISFVALSNVHEWTCLICLLTLLWTHMKVFVLANAVRC